MTDPGPGATLRQWREYCAMSTAVLGEAVGVGADQVERWERGEAVPTAAEARRLAAALGLPPGVLPVAAAPVAAPVEVPVEAPVEVPEIAIHLLAPTGPAPIPVGSRGSGLAAVRQWGSSLWDRALGWGRRIRSDRSRFTMVLALGGAFLFFVLAAVAFSQAHTAQQEAAAARSELVEASAAIAALGRERDALSDRLLDLEDDLAAAEQRANEAEAAARAEW
ncbi:MAG: helix-turn-helix transcriptional regulator, partial [Actinomycetota bacterium]